MAPIVIVLLCGLAVSRLTRLWRDDSITEPLRDRLYENLTDPRGRPRREAVGIWLTDLLECPWCLSGWLSIATIAAVDLITDHPVPVPGLIWLAVWQVAVTAYWATELLADHDQVLVETGNRVAITGHIEIEK